MKTDEPTHVDVGPPGYVTVRSPEGAPCHVDLWALNDLLHNETTRQQARKVLKAATIPYHIPAESN